MSQSRMLEIARVVQPHDQLSYSGTGPNLSFMTAGGWADMLVLTLSHFAYFFLADDYAVEPGRHVYQRTVHGHICAYSDSKRR